MIKILLVLIVAALFSITASFLIYQQNYVTGFIFYISALLIVAIELYLELNE